MCFRDPKPRKYSNFCAEIERVYEPAIIPSRFEIVQKQLEQDKYLSVQDLVDYAERTPKLEAPPVPDEIENDDEIVHDPNITNYI